MTVIKFLAFVLLGIGAFLVYGAKFIAVRLDKGKTASGGENDKTDEITEEKAVTSDLMKSPVEEDKEILQKLPNRTILNVKMAGMVFILAGGILVLVAFR